MEDASGTKPEPCIRLGSCTGQAQEPCQGKEEKSVEQQQVWLPFHLPCLLSFHLVT